jgi:prepilin-type N-terminal cleavage/methylation domain-containing protein
MFGTGSSGLTCQVADRRRPRWRVPTIFQGASTAQRLNGSTAQRNSGFSLLEMIVATTVLSLAIVGLLGLIRASLANAARVREYDRAAMRARSTMTELLATDPLPVPARLSGQYDDKSGWEARTTPAEMPITPRIGGVMVARVNLTVWWNSEGRRKTAIFDGFRRIQIGREHERLLQ